MAPRRGARVIKVDHVIDYNNLTVKEVLCPICRSILIEPVTLPCNHVFCSSCFQGTMENANLVCPLCRMRIGSWLRSSKKENKLINIDYWNAIKKLFPVQIKNKLDGVEENLDFEIPLIRLSEPGELKKEYESQIQKQTELIRKQREAEAKASEDLIRKLKAEEEYRKAVEEEKLKLDEEIAKKLAEELNCSNRVEKNKNPCVQSSSKLKTQSNHVQRVGPLERFLQSKSSKRASPSPVKGDQRIKFDFSKKEYTCRIVCQGVSNNLPTKKNNINSSSSNLNILNKKMNEKLECVIEVEGSDSSDSIDSEYRYFKPVDYRRNPPCQKSNPIKVPAIKVNVIQIQVSAPTGQNALERKKGMSAFASFFESPLPEKKIDRVEHARTTRQTVGRRKSISPVKKQSSPKRGKSSSAQKRAAEKLTRNINAEKKNNNIVVPHKKSNESLCPVKKEGQTRPMKMEKLNSPPKRKFSEFGSEEDSPKKRNRLAYNGTFSRCLSTPSSPFRGFCSDNVNVNVPSTKTSSGTVRSSKVEPPRTYQKYVKENDKEKIKLQVKADFELAKKLQDQFNGATYSTRSSIPRKGIKVTRQTTLDNMLMKKSYKI